MFLDDLNLRDSSIWGLAKTQDAMASLDEVPTQEDDSVSVNILGHTTATSLIPRLMTPCFLVSIDADVNFSLFFLNQCRR